MVDLKCFAGDELLALARLDLEQNRVDFALEKLKATLSTDDFPQEALAVIARVYAQLQLWPRAITYFERFLDLEPDATNESFQLGMVYFDSGKPAMAEQLWNQLLEKNPTHPPALFYSALLHAQANKLDDAKDRLQRLLSTAPSDNLYFNRGKELLDGMTRASNKADPKSNIHLVPDSPYKTEH